MLVPFRKFVKHCKISVLIDSIERLQLELNDFTICLTWPKFYYILLSV